MTERRRLTTWVLVAALAVLVAIGLWKTQRPGEPRLIVVVREPPKLMGTTCSLAVVVAERDRAKANAALDEAEAELHRVEALMSSWLKKSEIGRLNSSQADVETLLSAETLDVLMAARHAAKETGGAFDVTCRPLIELWRKAGETGRLPSAAEIAAARAESNWESIELTGRGAVKRLSTARVDLGGIAKGYAIDRAVAALRLRGVAGGIVDIGGDVFCFGPPAEGEKWPVDVRNPFGPGILAQLKIGEGEVCTSGNYLRFTEIDGRRYSHIIDPRTGRPAEAAVSVTVIAPDALTADVWATALSVLGPNGMNRLPEGVEAMLVVGDGDDNERVMTDGFQKILDEARE